MLFSDVLLPIMVLASIPIPVSDNCVVLSTGVDEEVFIVMFSWANTGVLAPINKIDAANTPMTATVRILFIIKSFATMLPIFFVNMF